MRNLLSVLYVVFSAHYVNSQVSLLESGNNIVRPGQTLDVTCTVTGVSLSDSNKLSSIEWARQAPGKGLEWMGRVIFNGDLYYAEALKGRITISRDTSKGNVYLKLNNVNVDDSGRYHCARGYSGYAMDIWGSGISVSVTSVEIITPQVFPLIPIGQEGNSFITFGCLARKYFPNPLSVVWSTTSGDTLSGEKNIPSNLSGDPPSYNLVSQITVSSSEWNSNKYICDIRHFSSSIQRIIPKGCRPPPESPTVHILQGSCLSDTDNFVDLSCQAYNLTSEDAKIIWFINEKETTLSQDLQHVKESNDNLYGLHSTVSIPVAQWNNGMRFKCQVTDKKTGKSSEATAKKCSDSFNSLGIEVIMVAPTIEDIYVRKIARIGCMAYNLKQASGYEFDFDHPGAPPTKNIEIDDPLLNQNGTYTVISFFTMLPETWDSNTECTCIFKHPGLPSPIIKTISKKKEKNLLGPLTALFPPSPEDIARDEICTLTCIAYGFYPDTIFMSWTVNDNEVSKDQYVNTEPKPNNRNQSYSASSFLGVPCSKWKEGESYSCLVGHPGTPQIFSRRVIDKFSGNPTKVNVSVAMCDSYLTCY